MLKQIQTAAVIALAALLIAGCTADSADERPDAIAEAPGVLTPKDAAQTHTTFNSYWYQGLAELSRYELEQSRYGELHKGESVTVFVTEDFLTDKQVKYEGRGPRDNAAPILKLNHYRRFYTGLYPYTMMTSVFTPTAGGDANPLKVTTSNQEWCGSTFTQANLREGRYEIKGFSYFQSEGDWETAFTETILEDGLWLQVRRDPAKLPTGDVSVVPGSHYTRLMHLDYAPISAKASVSQAQKSTEWSADPIQTYTVEYPTLRRTLKIHFEEAFPHVIVGWEEISPGIFGDRPLTTRAKLTHALLEDYWSHHSNADAPLRTSLGLAH